MKVKAMGDGEGVVTPKETYFICSWERLQWNSRCCASLKNSGQLISSEFWKPKWAKVIWPAFLKLILIFLTSRQQYKLVTAQKETRYAIQLQGCPMEGIIINDQILPRFQ